MEGGKWGKENRRMKDKRGESCNERRKRESEGKEK